MSGINEPSVFVVSYGVNYDGYLAGPRDVVCVCGTLETARERAMEQARSLILWAGPPYFLVEKMPLDRPRTTKEAWVEHEILTQNGAEWEWSVISVGT